jgi:hypothetical protein
VRWVLAGYGPAALAVSGHLLLRMVSDRSPPTQSHVRTPLTRRWGRSCSSDPTQ